MIGLDHTGPYFCSGGDLSGDTGKPQTLLREYTHGFKNLWLAVFSYTRATITDAGRLKRELAVTRGRGSLALSHPLKHPSPQSSATSTAPPDAALCATASVNSM